MVRKAVFWWKNKIRVTVRGFIGNKEISIINIYALNEVNEIFKIIANMITKEAKGIIKWGGINNTIQNRRVL